MSSGVAKFLRLPASEVRPSESVANTSDRPGRRVLRVGTQQPYCFLEVLSPSSDLWMIHPSFVPFTN
jgi:hypothetical protein